MIQEEPFELAQFVIKKLHPNWTLFIDDFMRKIKPVWLGIHSKDKAHFIHLIGYGKLDKGLLIITDLLELLSWHNKTLLLLNSMDKNAPDIHEVAETFLEKYPLMPEIIFTDHLYQVLQSEGEYGDCQIAKGMGAFLKNSKELTIDENHTKVSQAKGTLVISYLDMFLDDRFIKKRFLMMHLFQNQNEEKDGFRHSYMDYCLHKNIKLGILKREELIFFAKDKSETIQNVLRILDVKQILEEKCTKDIGVPVKLSYSALDYYLAYVFEKNLPFYKLKIHMTNFFRLVIQNIPLRCLTKKATLLEIQFKAGWKYDIQTN